MGLHRRWGWAALDVVVELSAYIYREREHTGESVTVAPETRRSPRFLGCPMKRERESYRYPLFSFFIFFLFPLIFTPTFSHPTKCPLGIVILNHNDLLIFKLRRSSRSLTPSFDWVPSRHMLTRSPTPHTVVGVAGPPKVELSHAVATFSPLYVSPEWGFERNWARAIPPPPYAASGGHQTTWFGRQ